MKKSLLTGPVMRTAVKAIIKAGSAINKIYHKNYSVSRKPDNEPVCEADIISNRIIQRELKPLGYPVLSEESADDLIRLKSKKVWIIDPLDGTNDFINRTGEFTIMIGLVEVGKPVMGVIYNPAEKILYYAAKGEGSFIKKTGRPIRLKVSAKSKLNQVKVYTSRFHFSEIEKEVINKLKIKSLVTCGSGGQKISLIAQGKGELNINLSDKTWEWDICAADIILSEAWGRLTDKNGKNFVYNKKQPRNLAGYVASNGLIHKKIIEALKILKLS